MKKLIVLLVLLLVVNITAQDYSANAKDGDNSSSTALGSAAVFTGTVKLLRGYNSITITVRSNQSGTYKVLFGTSTTITTATAIKTYSFSYTANDTLHTKHIPVEGSYYKIVYTNGATAQTTFYLEAILNQIHVLPTTPDGKVDIVVSSSALPAGAATSANQTTQIAKEDSLVDVGTAAANSLNQIDNSVDGNYLNVNMNLAGTDASANTGNADATTQRVVLASNQPTVAVTLTPIDTVTVKSIVNALPAGTNNIGDVDVLSVAAGDNNIGNVDIVTLPSGNLGQQLSAASLSVTPATNITDATYIGDIKFGEALPAGSAIVGQVGIDQTTDGTTNKVQARNATHDNFNANANIQVANVDVANGNPVPVSDAGGSLTVDGTVTANAGTNLNTSALSLEATQLLINSKLSPANRFGAANTQTVITEIDSVTFTSATTWVKFSLFAVDDTLEYSVGSNSFAQADRLLPGQSYTTPQNISPTTYPKLYIRRKGGAGTVTYDYSWWGY